MRIPGFVGSAAVLIVLGGCAGTDVIVKKQTEMEARLEQISQGNASAATRMELLTTEVQELRSQVRTFSAELEALKSASRKAETPRETKAAPPVAEKIELVNAEEPRPAGNRESNAQDAYMKAFGIFSANRYPEAIAAFEAFIRDYPESEFAANAQYWIGECYYTQRQYPKALEAFTRVTENYPQGKKVADAMLKIGYSLISMNEPAKADVALRALVDKYPASEAAAKARERLDRH